MQMISLLFGKDDAGRLLVLQGGMVVTMRMNLQGGINEDEEGMLGVRPSRIINGMRLILGNLGEMSWIWSMEWIEGIPLIADSRRRPRDLDIVQVTIESSQDGTKEGEEWTLGVRWSRIMNGMGLILGDLGERSWIWSMEWVEGIFMIANSRRRPRDLAIVHMTMRK